MIDLYAPTGYMLTFTYCRILSDEITKKTVWRAVVQCWICFMIHWFVVDGGWQQWWVGSGPPNTIAMQCLENKHGHGLDANEVAIELEWCGHACEYLWSIVQRHSGLPVPVASSRRWCRTWDGCNSPGVMTQTPGQSFCGRQPTTIIRLVGLVVIAVMQVIVSDQHTELTSADIVSWPFKNDARSCAISFTGIVDDRIGTL